MTLRHPLLLVVVVVVVLVLVLVVVVLVVVVVVLVVVVVMVEQVCGVLQQSPLSSLVASRSCLQMWRVAARRQEW